MQEEWPKDLFILEGISNLTFNKDFTKCALSKKKSEIYIYEVPNIKDIKTWKLLYTLTNHTYYISSLDWNAESNKLLSVSHDKTVIVWKFENDKWNPDYLVYATKVGYLCGSWNKRGDKLCAGTSNRGLVIGTYIEDKKWWKGQNIKCHKGSVTCVKIDPLSLFVISGSTDFKVYISSCYIPEIDDKYLTAEQKALAQDFGVPVYKFDCDSWVDAVEWGLDGNYGYVASHNSNIAVIHFKEDKSDIINCPHSPGSIIVPNGNSAFYCAAFDREIYYYEYSNGKWDLKKCITRSEDSAKDSKKNEIVQKTAEGVAEALKKYGNQARTKASLIVSTDQNIDAHSSLLSSISVKGNELITSDLSGFVKFWKL